MAVLKGDKIISADIVHTDSGLLGGNPPEYYAKSDEAILPWKSRLIYSRNDLCYLDGVIYRSRVDNNKEQVTDLAAWQVYGNTEKVIDYEQLVNYTMLYDQGDECSEVTGGWYKPSITYNDAIITKKHDSIEIKCRDSGTAQGIVVTSNKFNFVNYRSLMFIMDFYKNTCTAGWTNADGKLLSSPNNIDNYIVKKVRIDGTVTSDLTWNIGGANYNKKAVFVNLTDIQDSYFVAAHGGSAYAETAQTTLNLYNCTAFKPDTWQLLCTKAGITAATMDALLSSSANCAAILSNADAVNYMIKQCTGDFMVAALQSSTFKAALNNSQYKTKVQANPHWSKFIAMLQ